MEKESEYSRKIIIEPYVYKDFLDLTMEQIIKVEKEIAKLYVYGKIVSQRVYSDFDDTIVTRQDQISESRFEKNRGTLGNNLVENIIGVNNFLKKYYSSHKVVEEISRKTDIILTAGKQYIQKGKIEAVGINHLDSIVVDKHILKPRAILDNILQSECIPKKIIFYDDKAFYLKDHFRILSELLQNEVELNQVTLSKDNIVEIQNIDTIIIKKGKIVLSE